MDYKKQIEDALPDGFTLISVRWCDSPQEKMWTISVRSPHDLLAPWVVEPDFVFFARLQPQQFFIIARNMMSYGLTCLASSPDLLGKPGYTPAKDSALSQDVLLNRPLLDVIKTSIGQYPFLIIDNYIMEYKIKPSYCDITDHEKYQTLLKTIENCIALSMSDLFEESIM